MVGYVLGEKRAKRRFVERLFTTAIQRLYPSEEYPQTRHLHTYFQIRHVAQQYWDELYHMAQIDHRDTFIRFASCFPVFDAILFEKNGDVIFFSERRTI